jgi:hypothetical protein
MGDFDRPHVYVQWGGKLPGGEIWSCGVRLAQKTGWPIPIDFLTELPGNTLKEWTDGYIKDAVLMFHTSAAAAISTACKLSFVKANKIGKDGKYIMPNTNEYVYPDVAGGGGGMAYPNQVALVVSLLTNVSRGPAHRGRFYMPAPTSPVDGNTGLISAVNAQNVAFAAKTFIEALSDTPGLDVPGSIGVSVMSRKTGAATARRVEDVAVGRALDTQRRRRNKLPEFYQNLDIDQGLE